MKPILTLGMMLSVLALMAPKASAMELTVTGNGAGSKSLLQAVQSSTTIISQSNQTSIKNVISATADTGGNTISGTTGGESVIETGNAKTTVDVKNQASSNVAEVENCGCDSDALMVNIDGNGAKSSNTVKVADHDMTALIQSNKTAITNVIEAESSTGDNDIKNSTGGDNYITTGEAKVDIDVENMAGSNAGAITGSGGGSDLDFYIGANGYKSVNKIEAVVESGQVLSQTNQTGILNAIGGEAETGENDIKNSTGGENYIETGAAKVDIDVLNQAGFNHGSLDCDCLTMDVEAKIADNGAKTKNTIKAKIQSAQMVSQVNTCGSSAKLPFLLRSKTKSKSADCFTNMIGGQALTGDNSIKGSTMPSGGDPSILTGLSDVYISVENQGGINQYGPYLYW